MARKKRANPEARMGLAAHLKELRNRITIALLAVAAAAIAGFFVSEWVIELLSRPLDDLREAGQTVELNITTITQSFNLRMLVGFIIGVVASSPIWLYELLAFFIPGLNKKERRYIFGFIVASIPLFFAGCATGWYVLPRIINIFVGFAPGSTTQFLTAQEYFMFSLRLIVAIGCAFIMPVILVMLNFANMITAAAILKGWRWAIIIITVFAAMMTPPGEIISMFILAVPILILYFAAALVAFVNDKRRARKLAKEEAAA